MTAMCISQPSASALAMQASIIFRCGGGGEDGPLLGGRGGGSREGDEGGDDQDGEQSVSAHGYLLRMMVVTTLRATGPGAQSSRTQMLR